MKIKTQQERQFVSLLFRFAELANTEGKTIFQQEQQKMLAKRMEGLGK